MATIKEIAQEAGVSIGTVDRVLHNRGEVKAETRARIEETIQKLNYKPNVAAQGLAVRKKKIKIVFLIPDDMYNPFFRAVYEGAKNKADELKTYNVHVKFIRLVIVERHPGDNAKQEKSILRELQDADGLVTMGVGQLCLNAVNYMQEQSRPVVVYNDREKEITRYLAFVGCDYVHSGRLAAGLCHLLSRDHAKIVIFSKELDFKTGDTNSYHGRLAGFQEELQKKYPEMEILQFYEVSFNPIDNYIAAQKMIAECPEVDIVYVINPGDYSICDAVHRVDTKHQIRMITNDLTEIDREMIENKMIDVTISQEPERQGSQSLDILFRYLAFGKEPEERENYTNLSIHIEQNL